jgi:hypothetical protein
MEQRTEKGGFFRVTDATKIRSFETEILPYIPVGCETGTNIFILVYRDTPGCVKIVHFGSVSGDRL